MPVAESGFHAMRADLVQRGLLDERLRLTAAGHAHAELLMAEYRVAEAPCEPSKPRVRWKLRREVRRHA